MADLSVAHRAALAQIIEQVPDRTLRQLAVAVGSMSGERARTLETMLNEAVRDRARRARGLASVAPLFRPRPDGVAAPCFAPQILARLWKCVAVAQADLLIYLDPRHDYQDDSHRVATVCARLCASAAAAVRDEPDLIWPASLGEAGDREEGLAILARACDLGGLAQRALPSLKAWVGRPDGDQVAELRLLLRDAASISSDGAQMLLEVLFAHLTDAPLVLRLVAIASPVAARDTFLSGSELAIFVTRLIDAAEVRAARVAAHRTADPVEPLRADLEWIAQFLTENDATVQIGGGSAWGKRIGQVRRGVSKTLGGLLGRVSRAVDPALPMIRAHVGGPMRRETPDLDAPIEPEILAQAHAALDLVRATRTLAAAFGCEGPRQALMTDLTGQLIAYADLGLEEIHAGAIADTALAARRVILAADFLERIEQVAEGRAVRRRVAAAGVSIQAVSPKAA